MVTQADTDHIMKFPILVGDIGGTNARFAILVDAYAEPKEFPIIQTADFPTIDEAIQNAILDHTSIQPRSAVLAIAGPVEGDEIDLTNCAWVVKPHQMMETLGLRDITVLNDFEAQALAVVSLEPKHLEKLGGGAGDPHGSRAVLGPGTGLGVAGMVRARNSWVPVPGEGGHVDMGPRTARDLEIFPHLEHIEGRISGEQLLCGRGLQNIYRAICKVNGTEAILQTPAEITAAGLSGESAEAKETLALFVVYLGRLAGDFALTFMARGGVYLAGGIVQKIVAPLKDPSFRQAFEDKAPHGEILRETPVYIITHPLAALSGLSAFSRTPTRFGVSTEGRRWRRD
ncbi:MAG: glucokinase [Phyllobacterium sp.]|jgi:glucokinase|uniref:glucokinase n=1 Tax=Phyllobacterium sp. TaxID=1871046 RepID=UPI0030F1BDF2